MIRVRTIALALPVVLVFTLVWALQNEPIHDFEGRCHHCHVGLKDPTILTDNPDILCLTCHENATRRSHPSGIIPARDIPKDFPLFNGRLTCISCHLPHRDQTGRHQNLSIVEDSPYLLRYDTAGRAFCYQCHKGSVLTDTEDSHAVAFQQAHILNHEASLKKLLDDSSRMCLSCHDGTLSKSPESMIAGVNWQHGAALGSSHPIGVEYADTYSRKSREYHPPLALDTVFRLPEGKIGCETCHDHYSKQNHLLVMDNHRSRLCLSCHNL